MQEYILKRTKEGYDLGYKDIVGLANSLKEFVEKNKQDLRYANLQGANLNGTDLRYCDLSYSDLSRACLRCADLNDSNKRGVKIYPYRFIKTADIFEHCFLAIGCQTRRIKDWNRFFYNSDEVIQTERNTYKFKKITKEYAEAIETFKKRFDNGEIK
jgi:hypothetical protein